jgi:hypothetical protein
MKQVLPRTSCLLVFALSLLLSPAVFAEKGKINPSAKPAAISITAPADLTVNTDPYSDKATNLNLGTPLTTGNVIYTSHDAPQAFPIGTTKITWLAMDEMGEIVTATQNVIVVDREKPYIARLGEISVPNDPGKAEAVVQLFIPYAIDNSGAAVTITNDAPSIFHIGTTNVIWTATDIFGNSDTTVQQIIVIDNELPIVSLGTTSYQLTNAPGKCGASVTLEQPTATDNWGILSIVSDAPDVFPVGTTTVTWTVTDFNNYHVRVKQTVTVTDTEKPVITAPANKTVATDPGKSTATVAPGSVQTADNCGIASINNNAPAVFPIGSTTVTWTVTDGSGNTSTAVQTVTVIKDLQAPVLTGVPTNTTVSCENVPAAPAVGATDNLDPAPVVTFTQTSTQGSNSSLSSRYNYTITRTWTATDRSGNKSTAKQTITVVDKTAPVINIPAIVLGTDPNTCGALVSYTGGVTDNAGGPLTVTYSKASGSVFATGNTIVSVTARDVSGNTASTSFTVTVNDVQKPTIKAPANISVTIDSRSSSISASGVKLGTPVTGDNCGVSSIANNAPSSYPVGTTSVTWTVKDNAGNSSTAVQTVTVSRKKTNSTGDMKMTGAFTAENETLNLAVAPNPSRNYFTLKLQSDRPGAINLRVLDISGRVVEARSGLVPNSTLQIGNAYPAGYFVAEIMQGDAKKTVQLIKIR